MSDERKDPPEFVAVTPRGSREPSGAEPDLEPEAESVRPEAEAEAEASVAPAAAADDNDSAESEAPAADVAAEPAESAEPAPGAAEGDASAEPETGSVAPEPVNLEQPATETPAAAPEAAAPTLKWTPPSLERPTAPAEPGEPLTAPLPVTAPQAEPDPEPGPAPEPEPEPGSAPAAHGDSEVSVRDAAEGMAAALAGRPAPAPATYDEPTRSIGPVAIVTAVLVVLALAAAALLAVTAHSNSHNRAVTAARAAALDAAKRETAVALTYDYRTLDADFQRAEAGMSRKFRANYAQTAASSVAPLAEKTHAITTGSIAAAGVVSATPDSARVLVFANQTVENKLLNATSRLDRSVIEVTMVKENGRWVIDNLQPF